MNTLLTALTLSLALAGGAGSQDLGMGGIGGGAPGSGDPVTVSVNAPEQVAPGGDLPVAIVIEMSPGWHVWTSSRVVPEGYDTYEWAELTALKVIGHEGPLDPRPEFIAWPEIHAARAELGEGPQTFAVYEGRAIIGLPVLVADDAAPGRASLTVQVSYQACNDRTCLAPVDEQFTIDVRIVPGVAAAAGADFAALAPVFAGIRGGAEVPEPEAGGGVRFDLFGITFTIDTRGVGFLLLLLAAFFGGFLLNLTPCVLPVIPLKIMGLSAAGSGQRGRTLALGLSMTGGVIGFWLLLGGLIAGVAGFTATNQLFQYPLFTIGVGVFIAVMAIGMCGLFSIQLPQKVHMINPNHETLPGSFLFGIMTAILSTPCTAPFMGAAAAWAATQSPVITLLAFAAIGAGMASPYLVLAAFPKLVDRMPRTGPASELIKQVMGLLMLAAAAYFAGVGVSGLVVSPPDPPSRAYWWVVGAFGIMAGGWLAWRTVRITTASGHRIVFAGLGCVIVAISTWIGVRMTDKGPIDWVYYTPDRFAAAKAGGNVVVMDFTAEWCLNCKALEETVLRNAKVVERLAGEGVVPIKVDLTGKNTDGNEMLGAVDRLTIPLLVVFNPDGEVVFLGDYYTVDQVLDAVNQAGARKVAAN